MRIIYRLFALARALFGTQRVDADLADELRFHLDRETEANIARGMAPEAARRSARLTVGSVDNALEMARDERPGSLLRQIARDLRFGTRLLTKSPVFAVAGIAIIALGIGAVTAIFTVIHGIMLRPLPFAEPERLVSIWSTTPDGAIARQYPNAADVHDWHESNRSFSDIALARTSANLNLVGSGDAERLQGARLSPNAFSVLGVSAAIGRTFASDEGQDGHDQVVLLSDGLWRRRFAGDSSVVGRRIQLNGLRYTVIGVMPPDFQYPTRDYQAWVPLVVSPRELTREETQNYLVVARLRAGVAPERAQADLDAIIKRMESALPIESRGRGVLVEPMLASAVRDVRPALIALLVASACLLLIACLNLSNLLAARAAARSAEFAVRLALGASRARLILQTIAEVAPLLAAGGVLGVLAATFGVRAFVAAAPTGVPRLESVAVSTPVILMSLAVLVATGLAASVIPALQALRADFTLMTKEGGRASTAGRSRGRARRIGIAAQIAFALPLLVGASLLIRSALEVSNVELGFAPEHVASFHLAVPRTKYPSDAQVAEFYDRLLERVRSVPGVTHAGLVNRLPLAGNQTMSIHVEKAPGTIVDISAIDSRPATPDYFETMGIALRGGRAFTGGDDAAAPPVAIVDDRLARTMWPGQNALGKRVQRFDGVWCAVVGVVAHIHANAVDADPRPQVYWSYRQVTQDRMVLVVRGPGDAGGLVAPIRETVRALDPDQPIYDVRTMDVVVARSLTQRRVTTVLIVAFGMISLVLVAVGIYGVVAYGVTQRIREFGIRVALGATGGEVARLVVREGILTAVAGSTIGLGGAALLSGTLSTLVFGVAPRDVVSLGGATLVLLFVAVIASYVPARRASAVDPALALRAE